MTDPTGKQILSVLKRDDGTFATRLDGEVDDCFAAILCISEHFANGVGTTLDEVCKKLLEASKDSKIEKIGTESVH